MKLKEANTEHIGLIQRLAKISWESAYAAILSKQQIEYMLTEMYSAEELTSNIQNPNYHYFLIEHEGNDVGFVGFEHHYQPDTTKLHRVYLLPEYKGIGLGKAAVNLVKDKTAESGDHRIILNVNKNNSARRVYESQGFKVYDEGVFDIGQGYVMDDYLMEFRF